MILQVKLQFQFQNYKTEKNDLWLTLPPIRNTNPEIHVVLQFAPSIRLKVCEGKDLPAMDIGRTSDPFVEICFGKEKKKTKIVKETLNPQWNETFDFQVKDMSAPIFFHVYDWDLLSCKDKMGQVLITLTSLKAGLNKDLWLPLEKGGALRVEIEAIGFGSIQQNQQEKQESSDQQPMFGNQKSFEEQQRSIVKEPKTKFDDLLAKIKNIEDYKSYIRIRTNFGNLNFEISVSKAPIASLNFIRLCKQKIYDNSIIHRIIPGFMMEGGKIPSDCVYQKPFPNGTNENIQFESERFLLGMMNTAPTDFFVTFAPLNHLDDKYSCFGRLVGTQILKQMESEERTESDKPLKDIIILNTIIYLDPFRNFE